MMKPKDLIVRSTPQRLSHIGQKVREYRKQAGVPLDIFAGRCGISETLLALIEEGRYDKLDTVLVLRIAEELNISYASLFETDDERYYPNLRDSYVLPYVLQKAKEKKVKQKTLISVLDITIGTFSNWKMRGYITNPFVLGNIFSLLEINSRSMAQYYKNTLGNNETETEEEKTEEQPEGKPKEQTDVITEVVKACKVYKNIGAYIEQLDGLIAQAQMLRQAILENME